MRTDKMQGSERLKVINYLSKSMMIFNQDFTHGRIDRQVMVDVLEEFELQVSWQDRLGAFLVHSADGKILNQKDLAEILKGAKPHELLDFACPRCGGRLDETAKNEYGVSCDTCNYPYPDEEEDN